MDLLTVTCTRDKYAMQLLAYTLDRFVTDTCVHYVVIEDDETSYAEWLTLLLPHYTRHQLKLVHDYNVPGDEFTRSGYFRQQQIKLQMSEKIWADRYIIIDSKTIFFKEQQLSNWPINHGNRTSDPRELQSSRYYRWLVNTCDTFDIPFPEKIPLPMTPFVIHTKLARKLLSEIDVTQVIYRNLVHERIDNNLNPSEFILYTVYAMQEDPGIMPEVTSPVYFFCYYEEDAIKFPPAAIENKFLTFGIDRGFLRTEYLQYLSVYYNWLLSKGIEQKYLDQAWFGPLFNSTKFVDTV